ncbi:MAG: glycosyl transferase family 2 [Blastopirellula sp.]|nr:MAG: glycosyl transferase family 2 [Blastopirellula sp.]
MKKRLAVILAAGKGTRMNSDLPKVLVPVLGRPMIRYVIDALKSVGIDEIIVVVGHEADLVRAELSDLDNVQFVEQTKQLGTGHAVMVCREKLADFDGTVVVLAGDSPLIQTDSINELLSTFEQNEYACLLGTLNKDDPTGLGRIVRNNEKKFVGIVEEKDATDEQRKVKEVNMSTYVFENKELLTSLEHLSDDNKQNEYYLTDCPGILLSLGKAVEAVPVLKPCEALSINTFEHLADVEEAMRSLGYNSPSV